MSLQKNLIFSLLMVCLKRRPKLYLKIWLNSWQKNGGTHFARARLGCWSDYNCGRDIVLLYDPLNPVSSVPCSTGSGTGNRVWVWYWRNKLPIRIVLRTPMQTYFVYCLTSNFPSFIDCATHADYTWVEDVEILWRLKHVQWG